MTESDSAETDRLAEEIVYRDLPGFIRTAHRDGARPETTLPRVSLYLMKRSADRQEALMKDMHEQSTIIIALTEQLRVLTWAILIATAINIVVGLAAILSSVFS